MIKYGYFYWIFQICFGLILYAIHKFYIKDLMTLVNMFLCHPYNLFLLHIFLGRYFNYHVHGILHTANILSRLLLFPFELNLLK